MGEQGNSEVIIGEKHFKSETPEPEAEHQSSPPESGGKKGFAALVERVKKGFSKGYEYMDAGITPKQVPPDEIDTSTVANAVKNFRLEVGRFNKYSPEFAEKPFNAADILIGLGYNGNWEIGTTEWRDKHEQAYAAVRKGIDELVRTGALTREKAPEDNPDNEAIEYKIADEQVIKEMSQPKTSQE